jgi:2'-5' RNA ligase
VAGIRCFVAVELDEAARGELSRVLGQLKRSDADVKWVSPNNLHLTLKFLGDVPADDMTRVIAALGQAVAGDTAVPAAGAFEFELAGLGAFPSMSNPRVIWVGIDRGRDALASLASRVEAALGPLGFPAEGRGFSPHLTLGRCRSPRNQAELKAAMAALRDYGGPRVRVERVTLFSSDLRPAGPVYTPLAALPLAASSQGSQAAEVE